MSNCYTKGMLTKLNGSRVGITCLVPLLTLVGACTKQSSSASTANAESSGGMCEYVTKNFTPRELCLGAKMEGIEADCSRSSGVDKAAKFVVVEKDLDCDLGVGEGGDDNSGPSSAAGSNIRSTQQSNSSQRPTSGFSSQTSNQGGNSSSTGGPELSLKLEDGEEEEEEQEDGSGTKGSVEKGSGGDETSTSQASAGSGIGPLGRANANFEDAKKRMQEAKDKIGEDTMIKCIEDFVKGAGVGTGDSAGKNGRVKFNPNLSTGDARDYWEKLGYMDELKLCPAKNGRLESVKGWGPGGEGFEKLKIYRKAGCENFSSGQLCNPNRKMGD